MEFISQMLQITEMDKVVYYRSQDTFKDQLETTADWGEQEGHDKKLKKWEDEWLDRMRPLLGKLKDTDRDEGVS